LTLDDWTEMSRNVGKSQTSDLEHFDSTLFFLIQTSCDDKQKQYIKFSHKNNSKNIEKSHLTLRLLMSYIYGAPSKARNANVV